MAYAKVPLPCSDYGFGYQDFNKVAANCDAIADVLTPSHGIGLGGSPWQEFGRHNDKYVSRSVGRYTIGTRGSLTIAVRQLPGAAVKSVTRVSTGEFEVEVQGFSKYRIVARPEGTTLTDQLRHILVTFTDLSRDGPAFFRLQLYNQASAGAAFALADFAFCFSLWGEI